jgi:hypothetical protein
MDQRIEAMPEIKGLAPRIEKRVVEGGKNIFSLQPEVMPAVRAINNPFTPESKPMASWRPYPREVRPMFYEWQADVFAVDKKQKWFGRLPWGLRHAANMTVNIPAAIFDAVTVPLQVGYHVYQGANGGVRGIVGGVFNTALWTAGYFVAAPLAFAWRLFTGTSVASSIRSGEIYSPR